MRKILLLLLLPIFGMSQNQFAFGFDGTTAAMVTAGWQVTNQSSPATTATWNNATYTTPLAGALFGSGNINTVPVGQAGGNNSFAVVNFNSTTGTGIISNWLITPDISVQNGDVVTFYSRKGTDGATDYPDRLELRMSSVATVLPSGGSSGVGSFTTVCLTINPTLVGGFVYPKTWTQYSYTVSGLSGLTPVKFAFRYFVTNGGPTGANSDLIGIDTFSVDRPLSTDSFFKNNFSVYPNPVIDMVNISNLNDSEITKVSITDINGRVVKEINSNVSSVSVGDLNPGIYFLRINTLEGSGTSKFVKN
ncbi:T9SS-dependent choice-of-anchor J family protein [Flavobacterium terrigena]|uniref:Por secretion system C-terminal sorting domain-containing protein n=1 Tax=Flavobacterium terrigena TaxID=402734 RepID=A0A1H6SE70_9FLAO|nr:choice-of-anchor J domain-containing protein [Flavobacterium terrigena]SEI66211.1 Por secretion system C-terminal sorting domain-containing protein [Flavobacterium terrigena]